jgi:hypothetical protein
MNRVRLLHRAAASLLVASIAACGGGGGGSEPPPAVEPPSSGTYAWLLKASGPTDALAYGLSLVHRSAPDVEWVVEANTAAVTDARSVVQGRVDAAALKATSLRPSALVYIVGGDVRRIPLDADGSRPASRVQSAGSTSACRFLLEATDFATPVASRFVVSTAGTDGDCGSPDDGRAEVRIDPTLGPVLRPLATEPPLAVLRDPATLAPRGWLGATTARLWGTGSETSFAVRDAAHPILRVVASTPAAALVESAGGLSVLDFGAGTQFTESPVPGIATQGWELAGFDADHFYVWRNSDATTSATWTLLRIARVNPGAVQLATGTGQLASVGLGVDQIYATVVGATQNRLLRISMRVPGTVTAVQTSPTSTVSTVLTSGRGVHQIWRVSGIGTGRIQRSLQFVDETGFTLYATQGGGFPLGLLDEDTIDFRVSENRSRFLFVDGYGDAAFSGAALTAFDAATRQPTLLGTLPNAAELGGGFVFANARGGPNAAGVGFASRSSDGVVSDRARVFSFSAGATDSLAFTTAPQQP